MKLTHVAKSFFSFILAFFIPVLTHAADFSTERAGAWETFKKINIEGYKGYSTYGLVFDASSCKTNSYTNDSCDYAVSEGAGYGLLMAAIQKDQTTFDTVLHKTFEVMWIQNRQALGWKAYTNGSVPDTNAATDGDEDVAMALIIADTLQKNGTWKSNSEYRDKAQKMINSIYETMTVQGMYLCPGNYACTTQELNFSYFSPAWYKVFDQYEDKDHNWKQVIDKQYELLSSVGNKNHGLIPDWCTENGDVTYNGRPHNMTYDAIRVPWRIAIDSLWFGDTRAQNYLNTVLPYVLNKSGVKDIRMYDIPNGNPIEYHNELSVALWSAGGWGSTISQSQKDALVGEFRSFYNPTDKTFNATWAPAKWYYFNQALSILGAATIDGSLANPLTTTATTGGNGSGGNSSTPPSSETNTNGNTNTSSGNTQQEEQNIDISDAISYPKVTIHRKIRIAGKRVRIQLHRSYDNYIIRIQRLGRSANNQHKVARLKYSNTSQLNTIRIRHGRIIFVHADTSRAVLQLGKTLRVLSFTQLY